MPTESPSLEELVADARRMLLNGLPRPRIQPPPPKVIDLTENRVTISLSASQLADEVEPYV